MNDTIAAISTPTGESAIAAVRLSGPDCLKLAREVFLLGRPPTPRKMSYGIYRDRFGNTVDDAAFCAYAAPSSYTGENMLEIFPHGNPFILRKILDDLAARGARLAQPGEFTRRAFLNDKFDLSQAEAVARIIGARSDAALSAARKQFGGDIGRRISAISSEVLDMKALIEAYIDFPDEDLPPEDSRRLCETADRVYGEMSRLDRMMLGEFVLNLTDTAGLRRDAEDIEEEGIRRAYEKIGDSDICLLVIDSSGGVRESTHRTLESAGESSVIAVLNKCDLPEARPEDFAKMLSGVETVKVSCKNFDGIEALREKILEVIRSKFIRPAADDVTVGARHAEALSRAKQSLKCARDKIIESAPAELTASDLSDALDALGEIVGKTDCEEVLDRIFSKFCIGK